ncbi:ATP-binding cassette, subfamily B [Propionibacterium cyclohexanicum]|uniref:ATP-binding cassette, subfamily B n=1 Tax=Propionibacterium cyclohexanicum TaxID=64702 RepID=A0A1H9RSH7_9ACTN|nr:ABC transporter ATP-binding protein [Propionibacterium cyclohexanicum]SER75742.1 ATP-binding cassette, subfamily B [Propionibacterium cyclohexanicum]
MTRQRTASGSGDRSSPLARILRPVRGRLTAGVVLQLLASLFSLAPYLALLGLVSAMRTSPVDRSVAWRWVIGYLIAVSVQSAFTSIALLITHFADVRLQAMLRRDLADTLGRLPLGWFDSTGSGRVRKVVNDDVESLHQLVAHSVVEITAAITTPLVGVVLCFVLDWRMGIAAVVPVVAYGLTYKLMARGDMRAIMARIAEGLANVSQAIVDYVGGVAVLKVFGKASQGSRRFRAASEAFVDEFGRLVGPQMRAQAFALVWLSAPVVALVAMAVGVWGTLGGAIDPARAIVVGIVALSLPSTLYTVAASNQTRSEASEAAGRVVALLDEPPLSRPVEPRHPQGSAVTFGDVHFSYPSADGQTHEVLSGIDLSVPAGGSLALVGPSGAGKSTLALLAARFRDVGAGSIRIGGVDVRDIDETTLRSTVGVVLQTVQLPALTIAENIALASRDATRGQIVAAARAAHIHDRILQLPRGYESVIGQDARLSGGEAQRIAIARVLLQDTPVLILDEATSAADPETEGEIQEALARLVEGRTLIVIAHRLITIAHLDQIAMLDRGRVAELGTHRELLDAGGHYARMWNVQTEAVAA